MLSYAEAESLYADITVDWHRLTPTAKMQLTVHRFFKTVWDSYNLPEEEQKRTVIAMLSKKFPKDIHCKKMYPLGYFKNIPAGTKHAEIYALWTNRISETLVDYKGIPTSIYRYSVRYAQSRWKEEYGTEIDITYVANAFCLMLWRSAWGSCLEEKADKALAVYYNADSQLYYRTGSTSDEARGLDALTYYAGTAIEIDRISIKCLNALTVDSIMVTRTTQKLTEPTVYVGYKTVNATELTWIFAEDLPDFVPPLEDFESLPEVEEMDLVDFDKLLDDAF